jgi:nitrate reductase alpha subunit
MEGKLPPLLKKLRILQPVERGAGGWSVTTKDSREWEQVYRERWQHDKVVRTTHGVNCTGSCSWKVFVKDGIVAWETQQTDYPSTGPDMPEYEPRGCPRGASCSWYLYSPLRLRFPYIRSSLLKIWRQALQVESDPVAAWKSIVENPDKVMSYKQARGKGGLIRTSWDEVNTLIAATLIYTIRKYGPDRIFGVSPIPAMSMVSYAAGSRFLSLLGAPLLSFYDWYADLPPASPQIWGDQTDVPESADWFNAGYLLLWGSNVPQTRTPDAHFMTEARYRGTKVVCVSPDYAQYVKFADNWLAVNPGTDGALAMAMTHVILKEFYVDRPTPYFNQYAKQFTDLPFLVILSRKPDGYSPDRFLRAVDLHLAVEKPEWKTVVWDAKSADFIVPNGTIGHRWENKQHWNLKQSAEEQGKGDIEPVLSLLGHEDEVTVVLLPVFDPASAGIVKRGVPAKKIRTSSGEITVTTVFDLMLANAGVNRGLSGDYPETYDDPAPYTPAWQESITGIDRHTAAQVAREFAKNAADTGGRSMIIMGAGINHWFHADTVYRAILNLVLLTGCQGVNGGGWAHYVGQEKLRPLEGWQAIAFAHDWGSAPRLQNATSFYYFASEQWRYEDDSVAKMISPLWDKPRYENPADYNALAARLGWLPSFPQFDRSPLVFGQNDPADIKKKVIDGLKRGNLNFAIENPSKPDNHPKIMFVWRANLIGSSAKGHEYFLRHLLGTHSCNLSEPGGNVKTEEITRTDIPAEGKLDLMINLDFRMSTTGLYSDIVLPAATWYEKTDLSSTDMHPFVHPFNPAVAPAWESKTDWEAFKSLARTFSDMAALYFPEPVADTVMTPLTHDSPGEIAQPFGRVSDWKKGEIEPVPGQTMPNLTVVNREYAKVYDKMTALGPQVKQAIGAKGLTWHAAEEYEQLQKMLGTVSGKEEYLDCPRLFSDRDVAEAILTLASATKGSLALKAWDALGKFTGLELKELVRERAEEHITFAKINAQPQPVLSTPVYSGTETGNRRYSPFTTNVEHLIPWRTLTGRQQFYLDHELMREFGEMLPLYRPPLSLAPFRDNDRQPATEGKALTLRYLTPHYKWSFHSTYADTLPMLTLSRGGSHLWLNHRDAQEMNVADNDWVELYNRNGVVVARAVVSHRIPQGVVFMYHVQDRMINVPLSQITKDRGGIHNSPTRIMMKPTHMIGGYGQLSYGFNYYGPTGNHRDISVMVRRLKEVAWRED